MSGKLSALLAKGAVKQALEAFYAQHSPAAIIKFNVGCSVHATRAYPTLKLAAALPC